MKAPAEKRFFSFFSSSSQNPGSSQQLTCVCKVQHETKNGRRGRRRSCSLPSHQKQATGSAHSLSYCILDGGKREREKSEPCSLLLLLLHRASSSCRPEVREEGAASFSLSTCSAIPASATFYGRREETANQQQIPVAGNNSLPIFFPPEEFLPSSSLLHLILQTPASEKPLHTSNQQQQNLTSPLKLSALPLLLTTSSSTRSRISSSSHPDSVTYHPSQHTKAIISRHTHTPHTVRRKFLLFPTSSTFLYLLCLCE